MKTIKLLDGTVYEVAEVIGSKITYNGVSRDSLLFLFDGGQSLAELQEKFTPENCATVEIDVTTPATEDTEEYVDVNIHENYTIRTELGSGKGRYVTGERFSDDEDDVVAYVRMVQTTEAERMLERHTREIEDLIIAVLEG